MVPLSTPPITSSEPHPSNEDSRARKFHLGRSYQRPPTETTLFPHHSKSQNIFPEDKAPPANSQSILSLTVIGFLTARPEKEKNNGRDGWGKVCKTNKKNYLVPRYTLPHSDQPHNETR